MTVSLVFTVLNEAATIQGLLDAIDAQTRTPDEVVVVDGGSTDGTVYKLERWAAGRESVKVIVEPGATIAAGRNAAIKAAAGDTIAVTDAGCTPDKTWLEKLVDGFKPGIDVVMGFYEADPQSRFERMLACLNLPEEREVDPDKFMPSSRSVAFTRHIWEKAGGYPEWLPVGEDMYFDHKLLEAGAKRAFVPGALVRWRLRPDLRSVFRQYFRYGEGDGAAGMYPQRHALRFATYAAALVFVPLALRRPRLWWIAFTLVYSRMGPSYVRAWRLLSEREAVQALAALPALELVLDVAKMAGYLSGLRHRPEG